MEATHPSDNIPEEDKAEQLQRERYAEIRLEVAQKYNITITITSNPECPTTDVDAATHQSTTKDITANIPQVPSIKTQITPQVETSKEVVAAAAAAGAAATAAADDDDDDHTYIHQKYASSEHV